MSLRSKILAMNQNRCANCNHMLQSHKLTVRKASTSKKNARGARHQRSHGAPFVCVEQDCTCTEYVLIRSPSYR